jgi:hypothetical protein
MNGRMATVLADLAGVSDDDAILFDPPGEPIALDGASSDTNPTTDGEDS